MSKTVDISVEEIQRLHNVCKKMNKLLKRHRNRLVRGRWLLRLESKYQSKRIKYFFLFRIPALGKNRFEISSRVNSLSVLIDDLETFAIDYENRIYMAG